MHLRAPKLLEDIRSAADFIKTATDGLELQQLHTAARIRDYRRIIAFRKVLIHGYDVRPRCPWADAGRVVTL